MEDVSAKIDGAMKIKYKERVESFVEKECEVELPFYYKHVVDVDVANVVYYYKYTRKAELAIKITWQHLNKTVELESSSFNPNKIGRILTNIANGDCQKISRDEFESHVIDTINQCKEILREGL